MPEDELAVPDRLDKLVERLPPLRVDAVRHLVLEDLVDEVERERRADDRRVAKQHAVGGGQRVDAGGEQRLDRLGELAGLAAARGRDELAQEERVAGGSERDVLQCVLRERMLGGDCQGELRGALDVQWSELAPLAGTASLDEGVRRGTRRHEHEPGPRIRRGRDVAQEQAGSVVEPVRVLGDDERRHHQHPLEERRHRRLKPVAALFGVERVDVGRRLHLGVERDSEQWKPRREIRHRRGDERLELRACHLARAVGDDADELAQRVPPGAVRHRARVLLAHEAHLGEAERMRSRDGDETRLAHPGLTGDLEERELPLPGCVESLGERRDLLIPAHERHLVPGCGLALAGRPADVVRRHGALLPLDEQRLPLARIERSRRVEDVGRREDLAVAGAGGQPRGKVDGVPHDRIRAPALRPDVAREDVAAVDTGAERDARALVDDLAHGAQHALGVIPGARGRARRQVQLDGADVDVGLEPRDPVGLGRAPDGGPDLVQPLEEPLGSMLAEQLVGAGELQERDRDVAVLGLAARHREVVAKGRRDVFVEPRAGDVGRRRDETR